MANRVGDTFISGSYTYTITRAATGAGNTASYYGEVNVRVTNTNFTNSNADTAMSSSVSQVVSGSTYYYNVTGAPYCFSGCTNLVIPPILPSKLVDMSYMFRGCTGLSAAPKNGIPSSVRNLEQAFYYCTSLSGNITFNSTTLQNYSGVFAGTVRQIYVISGNSANISDLRNMVAPYSNVHYYTDDNPKPNIESVSIVRVAENNSTIEDVNGQWLYISAQIHTYTTYLPSGSGTSVNGPQRVTVTLDDSSSPAASKSTGFSPSATDLLTPVNFWIDTNDAGRHTILITATDLYKASDPFNGVISGSFATMDFHAGGDGVAIGTFSNASGFVVDMDTTLQQGAAIYGNLDVYRQGSGAGAEVGNIQAHNGDFIDKNGNTLTTYRLEQTPNTNIVRLVPGTGTPSEVIVPAIWG